MPPRVVVSWLAGLALGILATLAIGERVRTAIFDAWQTAAPRDLAATDVRVVLVDNESIAAVGSWPWPRYYLARLTEELAARGAKVIAYDILFAEPDRVRPETFVSLYPELSAPAAEEIKALQPMDALFGQVIGMAPVVLAHAGTNETQDVAAQEAVSVSGTLPPRLGRWSGETSAIPELDDVALGHGLVNARPDGDGVTRSIPLLLSAGGKVRSGFAMEIARHSIGAERLAVTPSSVTVGKRKVAVDSEGRMRLHFGDFPASHVISAADVLGRSERIKPDEFAGKAVVIGMSADGTSDIAATPAKAEEYGPLIQAQAVDALLRGGWLERPGWVPWFEWGSAAALALLALGVALFGRAYRIALGLVFAALPIGSWLAFSGASLLLDPARPLLVGGSALAGVALGLFKLARIERERLREALVDERVAAAEAAGEMETARAIQLGMVPSRGRLHRIDPRVDLDAILEPAKSVGGDFYDAVKIGQDRLAVAIADVTGKGVPAALYMAMSKALTGAAMAQPNGDPGTMLGDVNEHLLRDGGDSMSVTMLLVIIDLTDGAVRMACAGHEDPLLVSTDGDVTRLRLEGGPPLGIVPFDYPTEPHTLSPGDTLLLITDGVTEAQNGRSDLYGIDRVSSDDAIRNESAENVCTTLRDHVRIFEDGTDATDDLTVMAVRYLGA